MIFAREGYPSESFIMDKLTALILGEEEGFLSSREAWEMVRGKPSSSDPCMKNHCTNIG